MGALPRYLRLAVAIFLTPLGTLGFYSRMPAAYALGGALVLALCVAAVAFVNSSGVPVDYSFLHPVRVWEWVVPSVLPNWEEASKSMPTADLQGRFGALILATALVAIVFPYLAGIAYGKAWRSHRPRRAMLFSIAGTVLAALPIVVGLAVNSDIRSRLQVELAHSDSINKVLSASTSVRNADVAPEDLRVLLPAFMVQSMMNGNGREDFKAFVASKKEERAKAGLPPLGKAP